MVQGPIFRHIGITKGARLKYVSQGPTPGRCRLVSSPGIRWKICIFAHASGSSQVTVVETMLERSDDSVESYDNWGVLLVFLLLRGVEQKVPNGRTKVVPRRTVRRLKCLYKYKDPKEH